MGNPPDTPAVTRAPSAATVGEIGQPGGTSQASRPARPGRTEPGGRPLFLLTIVIGLCLGLPVAVIVVRAVLDGSLATAVTDRVVLDALVLSLVTTAVSLLITIVAGLPLAFVLARRQFRGRALLEAVIDLPIVLPPSVAGLALLLTLGREGLLGKPLSALGIELPFTTVAVVLAQAFVSAPFFIRSARLGFASIDPHLEDAARVDGATEAQLFRSISLPLAGSALAAGLVMSWARSLGEFGATIMFAGNVEGKTQTLPLVVYSEFTGGNLDGSIAAAAILVLAAFGVLVAVRVLHWGHVLDLRSLS
jgi:molybdate transport system permease protein